MKSTVAKRRLQPEADSDYLDSLRDAVLTLHLAHEKLSAARRALSEAEENGDSVKEAHADLRSAEEFLEEATAHYTDVMALVARTCEWSDIINEFPL